jgi:acetyltransferase-like isoleucine patch superfamily enzyme
VKPDHVPDPIVVGAQAAPNIKTPIIIEYGLRLRIDPTVFINSNCTILDTPVADIVISKHAVIGPNVGIYGVSHPMASNLETGHRGCLGRGIIIEERVWIGASASVL